MPAIVDDAAALEDPELAGISAMAYAEDDDPELAARVALAALVASLSLDSEEGFAVC